MQFAESHPSRACSICAALLVASDVSGNPVSHPLIVNISEFADKMLVGVEIVCELVGIDL